MSAERVRLAAWQYTWLRRASRVARGRLLGGNAASVAGIWLTRRRDGGKVVEGVRRQFHSRGLEGMARVDRQD